MSLRRVPYICEVTQVWNCCETSVLVAHGVCRGWLELISLIIVRGLDRPSLIFTSVHFSLSIRGLGLSLSLHSILSGRHLSFIWIRHLATEGTRLGQYFRLHLMIFSHILFYWARVLRWFALLAWGEVIL